MNILFEFITRVQGLQLVYRIYVGCASNYMYMLDHVYTSPSPLTVFFLNFRR